MKPVFETTGTCLNIKLPKELDHPASELIRRESDRIMGRYRALGMRSGCMKACHVSGYIEKLLQLSGVSRFLELEREEKEMQLEGRGI